MKSANIALLPTECLSEVDLSLNLPEKGQSPSSVEFLLHREEFYQHLYVEQHPSLAGVTSPKLTASYYHAREDIAMLLKLALDDAHHIAALTRSVTNAIVGIPVVPSCSIESEATPSEHLVTLL